jgi:hypothetical protein
MIDLWQGGLVFVILLATAALVVILTQWQDRGYRSLEAVLHRRKIADKIRKKFRYHSAGKKWYNSFVYGPGLVSNRLVPE